MDAMMPELNGAEATAALRAIQPEWAFICVYGSDTLTLADHDVALPTEAPLLPKPSTRERLVATIRGVLER